MQAYSVRACVLKQVFDSKQVAGMDVAVPVNTRSYQQRYSFGHFQYAPQLGVLFIKPTDTFGSCLQNVVGNHTGCMLENKRVQMSSN